MNREIRETLDNNNFIVKKITIKGNVKIIDNGKMKIVIKRKGKKNLEDLFKYLSSRSFNNYPKIIFSSKNYNYFEYVTDGGEPNPQKLTDLIITASLLHQKTTFYKNIDSDEYKYLYEYILNQSNYLENYYMDLLSLIEKKEFMSPSSYLFARNSSLIFNILNFCRYNIQKWYNIINEKRRVRIVQLHNNLSLEHFIKDKNAYLISWNNSKRDLPIYDLIILFNRYYYDFDFLDLLKIYEKNYPLLEEEKILLLILISLPDKLLLSDDEYTKCLKVKKFYDKLNASMILINDYTKKIKISN